MGKPRFGDRQRGFTLLELMVTVAIIAILAIVVIPYFFGESRKAKAKTEVAAMFAELAQKEESYKIDNGTYLAAAQFPVGVPTQQTTTLLPISATWQTLRVIVPMNNVYCRYTIYAGAGGTAPTTTQGTGAFAMPACAPSCAVNWYTLFATCEMDGNAGNSEYFTNSLDSTIQIHNEGQ